MPLPLTRNTQTVSSIQGNASNLRISGVGITASVSSITNTDASGFSVSCKSDNASQVRTSCFSDDAGLFRVSAIGNLTVSAHEVKQSDASSLRTSSIIDNGSISAMQGAANNLRMSAFSLAADTFMVSCRADDANLFRISTIGTVEVKNTDAGAMHVSCIGTVTVSAHEVKQSDAASLMVSSKSSDGALLRTSAIVVGTYNGTLYDNVRIDGVTNALDVVDYQHHEIHSGSHFFVKGCSDISATSTQFLLITPNSAKWPHMFWEVAGEGEFDFYFYEDCTVTSTGSRISAFNNNRNSTTEATVSVYGGPIIAADGTAVWCGKLGSGRSAGGQNSISQEIICKSNTNYFIRITKIGAGTLWLAYNIYWYEHTNLH